MKDFQNKQRFKKILGSLPILLLMLVPTFFMVKGAVSIWGKSYESRQTLDELEKEVAILNQRQADLKKGIERLQTSEGLEEEIRSKFNVVLHGEGVAIIIEERGGATTSAQSADSWYRRWWNAIIGQ